MLPYLHILVRVDTDGSLHALGAFTSKDKQKAYQEDAGLTDSQIRLDFYNGPFDDDTRVIYAGHRRWNMNSFQLGGYFRNENSAWTSVTHEGYVSLLRIDTTYAAEQKLEREALERYAKLQKRWRLSSYDELIAREGSRKTRANITLRFYEDALESFKPKTRRDIRALYALIACALALPLAVAFFMSSAPDYAENVNQVSWLPKTASNVSFYKSKQILVYEFSISADDFKTWAESKEMTVRRMMNQEIISRYKAYIPTPEGKRGEPFSPDGSIPFETFQAWQDTISIKVNKGLIAKGPNSEIAIYDPANKKAYFEHLFNL
ncbi:MAG: hypothetical protein ACPGJU_02520 [Coraliomargarita sp.]